MAEQQQQELSLHNWNRTVAVAPAKVVQAMSTADVSAAVRDAGNPSPVLAVGAMHSVNPCLTNTGGTLLAMSGLDQVLGLEAGGGAVRVQAGCKMAALYNYLATHDLELSFCPEIGDATVGSLVVCTSKDSSIDGPGYLSALLLEVTYVDEDGAVVTLTRGKHPVELVEFTCSYGMMGVVVEAVLETRRRVAVTTRAFCVPASSGAKAAAKILKLRDSCDALFAIMVPRCSYVYVEPRHKAGVTAFLAAAHPAVQYLATSGENNIALAIMRALKYQCFLEGKPPGRKTAALLRVNVFPATHFRRFFTNSYPDIAPGTARRLDFSFFEFDLPSFQQVVEGCYAFEAGFRARHGFGPAGFAVYFVNRLGYQPVKGDAAAAGTKKAAGGVSEPVVVDILAVETSSGSSGSSSGSSSSTVSAALPARTSGNYSRWGPGVSFMLDPLTGDADNPLWATFNEEYTAWAVGQGAIPSLSQTKGLKPGQVSLPQRLTRSRFLTDYYREYVVT